MGRGRRTVSPSRAAGPWSTAQGQLGASMQLGMGLHPCPRGNLQPCGDGPQICALNRFRHMSKKSPKTKPSRSPELCLGRIRICD